MVTEAAGEAEDRGDIITVKISQTRRQRQTTPPSTITTGTKRIYQGQSRKRTKKHITRKAMVMTIGEDMKIMVTTKATFMKIMVMMKVVARVTLMTEDLMMEEEEILMLVTSGISKIRIKEAIYRWPYSYIDVFIIEI